MSQRTSVRFSTSSASSVRALFSCFERFAGDTITALVKFSSAARSCEGARLTKEISPKIHDAGMAQAILAGVNRCMEDPSFDGLWMKIQEAYSIRPRPAGCLETRIPRVRRWKWHFLRWETDIMY